VTAKYVISDAANKNPQAFKETNTLQSIGMDNILLIIYKVSYRSWCEQAPTPNLNGILSVLVYFWGQFCPQSLSKCPHTYLRVCVCVRA